MSWLQIAGRQTVSGDFSAFSLIGSVSPRFGGEFQQIECFLLTAPNTWGSRHQATSYRRIRGFKRQLRLSFTPDAPESDTGNLNDLVGPSLDAELLDLLGRQREFDRGLNEILDAGARPEIR